MLKTSKEADDRLLWTGGQWKSHKTLAVLKKQQY
jgi:hypothetical protein